MGIKCRRCCIFLRDLLPVLFLIVVIGWSYYSYVVHMCLYVVKSVPEKIVYVVIYHLLLFMVLWSLIAVLLTVPAHVPLPYFLTNQELEYYSQETDDEARKLMLHEKAESLTVHCRTLSGEIRFCPLCKCIKPDRAHHCSACRRCVLKMDHHCLWVNNCICFSNYKLFVLLIFYAFLFTLFIAATSLQYCIKFWMDAGTSRFQLKEINIMFLFIASSVVSISLAILTGYHFYLIMLNRTTMEHSYTIPVFTNGPDNSRFNHGTYANFVDVFGEQKICWLLPIYTGTGDGVTFARNLLSDSRGNYQSMETSQVSIDSCYSIKTSAQLVQPESQSNASERRNLLSNESPPGVSHTGIPVSQQKQMS